MGSCHLCSHQSSRIFAGASRGLVRLVLHRDDWYRSLSSQVERSSCTVRENQHSAPKAHTTYSVSASERQAIEPGLVALAAAQSVDRYMLLPEAAMLS